MPYGHARTCSKPSRRFAESNFCTSADMPRMAEAKAWSRSRPRGVFSRVPLRKICHVSPDQGGEWEAAKAESEGGKWSGKWSGKRSGKRSEGGKVGR